MKAKRINQPITFTMKTNSEGFDMTRNSIFYTLLLTFFFLLIHVSGYPQDYSTKGFRETYHASDRVRSGIALGGLGTGYLELRKDGQFYNWTIFNNQPLSTGPAFTFPVFPDKEVKDALQFFIVRYQEEGKDPKLKLLQLNNSLMEAGLESISYYYPWMTGVDKIEYSGRFPFVNMKFSDPEMPFDIYLEAFSPFIPHDPKNSSLPGIYFNFRIENPSAKNVNVMLIASQRNCVAYDVLEKYFITDLTETESFKHFTQTVGGMDESYSSFGEMGMASLSTSTSYYLGWEHKHPYYENLLFDNSFPNINDTGGRNWNDPYSGKKVGRYGRREKEQRSFSSLAVTRDLKAGEEFSHSFLMTWFFPNNYGAHNDNSELNEIWDGDYTFGQQLTRDQGHYYENFFSDADEVAEYMITNKEELTERTRKFLNDFYASTVDEFVLDQINSNLNTFVTSSTFTENGNFGIREGMSPHKSWGPNVTIDVSLYGSSAIINLFPELQQRSMNSHRKLQTSEGEINHGLGYDLDFTQNGTWGVYHRIDMPGNYIQLVTRDFFHTGDTSYLREMWPSLKKAVEYVLNERDEDGDLMPDMTGIMCSYDNFPMYGLSSYIQSQWIASMRSMIEAAEVMQDREALKKYRKIYRKGSELMDEHLWNGEYYILSRDYTGLCDNIPNATEKDEACLTDQIIGQWIAHQSNLGYLFDKEHVKKALESIMEMSFKEGFGLRNCSWPEYPYLFPIHKSDLWVDQANTPWTGVELAFASLLIYEGFYEEGLEVIREVDNRQRNSGLYWDHQEFGGHYYRPMSSWQIVNAIAGLGINQGVYSFAPVLTEEEYTLFFSFNKGTAHYIKDEDGITLDVLSGTMILRELILSNTGFDTKPEVTVNGAIFDGKIEETEESWRIIFPEAIRLTENEKIVINQKPRSL